MKLPIVRKVIFLILVACFGIAIACQTTPSPRESYKALYKAVKAKNTEEIKKWMSKATIGFAEGVAAQQKKPVESVFENGFTATTFATSLPEMRDERIKDNMGALEVWNSKDQKWEDLPFVKEDDGQWRLAIGDLFGGTYVKPEKGQSEKDAEESNKMSNNIIQAPMGNVDPNKMPANIGKNPIPAPAANKPGQKQAGGNNMVPMPMPPSANANTGKK